jgi:hypothetical protein
VARSRRVAFATLLTPALLVVTLSGLAACGPERPKQIVQVTRYNDGKGVPLYVSADAGKLTGAPKDFQSFIRFTVRTAIEGDDGSCDEPPVYTVLTISDAGFGAGELSQCGVKKLVWAKTDGKWSQVLAYEGEPGCDALTTKGVPPGITGPSCRDADGSRPYRG